MAASMANSVVICITIIIIIIFTVSSSIRCVSSLPPPPPPSSSSSMCPHQSALFINTLQSQCPLSYSSNTPLEVDGDFLDRAMTSKQRNLYTSVLFHASWCPFSQKARSTFEVLSSMFPQIEHLAVEQSSAMPSIFSRYGTHSFPSILMVNRTSRVRYSGQKNLLSLVKFYKETTGLEPVQYFTEEHLISYESSKKLVIQPWNRSSVKEIITGDPILAFSVLFLCLRILLFTFPEVMLFLKAFWVSYVPHLNLDIFGETSQMLGRLLHMTDLTRVWTKLRVCKTRNFHEGAKSARVWASSLASVSVGKTSSARSSS